MKRSNYILSAQWQNIKPGQKWRSKIGSPCAYSQLEVIGRISEDMVLIKGKNIVGEDKTERMYETRLKMDYKLL